MLFSKYLQDEDEEPNYYVEVSITPKEEKGALEELMEEENKTTSVVYSFQIDPRKDILNIPEHVEIVDPITEDFIDDNVWAFYHINNSTITFNYKAMREFNGEVMYGTASHEVEHDNQKNRGAIFHNKHREDILEQGARQGKHYRG